MLDIGCGGGILAESLTKKGANVTAIDLADGPKCRQAKGSKTKLNINYQKISSSDLAETGKKYDVITCLRCLSMPRSK